jgi:hypothetical protein
MRVAESPPATTVQLGRHAFGTIAEGALDRPAGAPVQV